MYFVVDKKVGRAQGWKGGVEGGHERYEPRNTLNTRKEDVRGEVWNERYGRGAGSLEHFRVLRVFRG